MHSELQLVKGIVKPFSIRLPIKRESWTFYKTTEIEMLWQAGHKQESPQSPLEKEGR